MQLYPTKCASGRTVPVAVTDKDILAKYMQLILRDNLQQMRIMYNGSA